MGGPYRKMKKLELGIITPNGPSPSPYHQNLRIFHVIQFFDLRPPGGLGDLQIGDPDNSLF
jgi:hypothetical protein